jgi:geranylgeranyl diphosphate synthase type II
MYNFVLPNYLSTRKKIVERALKRVFRDPRGCPPILWKAMRYSVFAGGKRLRPILCLASAEAVDLPLSVAMRPACALELIHTYSLIHDDLPALDDDDLRRGRKTNHVVFGEDMAILAGDGLLTLAFEWLGDPAAYPHRYRGNVAAALSELASSAGYAGMVGGQASDIRSEGKRPSLSRVLSIHRRKTGALLRASVRLAPILKGAPTRSLKVLTRYGEAAGLAFQIVDDILNVTSDAKTLGKAAGSDKEKGKMTYPAAAGLAWSGREVVRLTDAAVSALKPLGRKGEPLAALARYMAERTR